MKKHRLNFLQSSQLIEWLRANEETAKDLSYSQLTEVASQALGFPVNKNQVEARAVALGWVRRVAAPSTPSEHVCDELEKHLLVVARHLTRHLVALEGAAPDELVETLAALKTLAGE